MDFFGLMILIQPAVLCLVTGTTLFVVGLSWLFLIRHFPKKSTKIVTTISIFLFSMIAFTLSIYLNFGLLPVYFETISPLPYSSVE